MKKIDLRSDTVTKPTPAMREAIYRAPVGDDVYGEDPTVNRLEAMAAERLGKEAGLFVASGTMGNLVAMLTHCGRGDEAIMGHVSHTFRFEQGGAAALGGIVYHTVPNQPDGTMRLEEIGDAIRADNIHYPRTRLVCLENTHNMCGGAPITAAYTAQVADLAHGRGLQVHLDGARLFNAAAALGVEAAALAAPVDSVMICLSKGLCAPVGSLLCGDRAFIERARRTRKVVGGGMRQAGILAAAGIVALEEMADRLDKDHARARRLAEGLEEIPGIEVEPLKSNLVYFEVTEEAARDAEAVRVALAERGVLMLRHELTRFRAVVHYWIDDEDIERALEAVREVV